jgi:DNA-binding NtrC family response regulator
MPKMDGIEVLQSIKSLDKSLPFIMLTGHGNVSTAVEAMKLGAYDFISKPPDLNRLLNSVRHALENKSLVSENIILKKQVVKKYQIIGKSKAIKVIHDLIDKVAPTDARVLVTGENGTGKELVAHNLHQKSERSKKPFIEVNCAAIPSELIESELFGHLKGAFTSAVKDRPGKFESANNGTLFLDEIADMSLAAQAKVLRALEENKVQRVGSNKDISINVRVIAATNKNLNTEIEKGNFREDLFHRLAVIIIEVPTLKSRKDDIGILVEHFVNNLSKDQGLELKKFESEAIEKLKNYPWSGNIRELRNVIERLMILGDNPITQKNIIQFTPK